MKYIITVILGFIALLLISTVMSRESTTTEQTSLEDNTSSEETIMETIETGTYAVLPAESSIIWTAEKPAIIGYTHHGTFAIREGTIHLTEAQSLSGNITLDMSKLTVTSLGGGKAGNESRLETHLKSGDFFEVETYPTATFTFTESSKAEDGTYTATGDLTIKDQTHPITIPLTVTVVDDGIILQGETEINRTKWDITFGSSNFFENLAENAINDMVKISLNIRAAQ